MSLAVPTARTRHGWWDALPGVAASAAATAAAVAVNRHVPALSALLVAMILGIAARHAIGHRGWWAHLQPGLALAGRRVLRAGIVLLGLQVSLVDIAGLGPLTAAGVVAVVAAGFAVTLRAGRALGVPRDQTLLVAAGFSICGAAAVAGMESVLPRRRREEAATAIALVVLAGSLMIGLMPLLAHALGLGPRTSGVWIGASVHEVAQAVAAGGLVGAAALKVAVVVKLARVLLLAPVLAVVTWSARRRTGDAGPPGARVPIVPLFVAGFLAMTLVRTTGHVPAGALQAASVAQTALLAAAMFALGTTVHWRVLAGAGRRPLILAGVATLAVCAVGGLTALLAAYG